MALGGITVYTEREVTTWENLLHPVLEKYLRKDISVLENQHVRLPLFINRKAFGINLSCSGKLQAFEMSILEFSLKMAGTSFTSLILKFPFPVLGLYFEVNGMNYLELFEIVYIIIP